MSPGHLSRRRVGGFSLVELMVSMVIGLVLTMAITVVLVRSESC
jgi:prepilin-type N-terminal cleavage/methylation domain-containing protein